MDVARGIVVGFSLVLSGITSSAYGFSRHAAWYGLTALDVILPSFVGLYGVGLYLSLRKSFAWTRILARSGRLFLFGLAFNMIVSWDFNPAHVRLTGVLQMFAVVGLLAAVVVRLARRPMAIAAIGGLSLAANELGLLLSARSCGWRPAPHCTLSTSIDGALIPDSRLYRLFIDGYDPEGLGVVLGFLGTLLLGYTLGHLLVTGAGRRAVRNLLAAGVTWILLGSALAMVTIPVNKRIWSSSYALIMIGGVAILLAVTHLIVDLAGPRWRWGRPMLGALIAVPYALGRNSFFIYFGKYVVFSVMRNLHLGGSEATLSQHLEDLLSFTRRPALAHAAVVTIVWCVVAVALHRRRIYVKV